MRQCGCKTEVYSRVVGYYRPVGQWNKGKQQEFRDRKTYDSSIRPEESSKSQEFATSLAANA